MRFSILSILSGSAWLLMAVAPVLAEETETLHPWRQRADCPPVPQIMPCPEVKPGGPAVSPTPSPAAPESPAFAEASLAVGGEAESAVGYIDSALIRNTVRLRYDSAYGDNRPDRAEFFYPKCGCFKIAGLDKDASGPPLSETGVDFQELSAYVELALTPRLSGFLEVPARFLNAEQNTDTFGFSDINAGFKYAFLCSEARVATFQLRTYFPTGDGSRGLGTDHVSFEPALLFYQKLSDRWLLEGEVRDWIPVGGSDFAGNVLRYGVGVSYELYRSCRLSVAPVAELVGWTVLNGKEADARENAVIDAGGDTIVNMKLGARIGLGNLGSVYAGYGRALTGDVWYRDIIRVEYRLAY